MVNKLLINVDNVLPGYVAEFVDKGKLILKFYTTFELGAGPLSTLLI